MLEEGLLEVRETIEKLSGTLIVADVNDFVGVENVWILDILVNGVLDALKHGRDILGTHLSEGPVPELLSVVLMVMVSVAHRVSSTTVVSEPHIVASLVKLNRHGLTELGRGEPGVGGHAKAGHDKHRLGCGTMDGVVANGAGETEHCQDVSILGSRCVRLPVVLVLVNSIGEGVVPLVIGLTGSVSSDGKDSRSSERLHHFCNFVIFVIDSKAK